MNLASEFLARNRRDDFVGVHVGTCAGTGLENVDREVLVVVAVGNGQRCLLNCDGPLRRQEAQFGICPGGSPFDQAE